MFEILSSKRNMERNEDKREEDYMNSWGKTDKHVLQTFNIQWKTNTHVKIIFAS